MDNNPKIDFASGHPILDNPIIREAQERLLRLRAERGVKAKPQTTLTRELVSEVNEVREVNEVKEASEASKESPSGDLPPKAEPLRVVSKNKIQNAKDVDSATSLTSASVEAQSSTGGGDESEAEQLFRSGRYNEISAADFIRLAWAAAAGNSWEETGCSETWEFGRYLLAHSEFQTLRGGQLLRALRRLTDLDEEVLDVILSEIERVRYAKGAGPLEWAAAMSCQYPLSDPEDLQIDRYNKFLSIAGWLQVIRGDAPIVLPVERLAGELGVTAQHVSNWRQRAQQQGLLSEVKRYVAHKQATQFRFAVERFSILRERGNL